MSQVFAVFLLMLFFFPALLSLLFASRSPLAIFWNFSWYFFLGELGEMATQNESGKLVGLFCHHLFASHHTFLVETPNPSFCI